MNSTDRISQAIAKVQKDVEQRGNLQDKQYFEYHQSRYKRLLFTIERQDLPGKRVLEIGSHYLQTSALLREFGYEVFSVDVKVFWDMDFVEERRKEFGINKVLENNLQEFESLNALGMTFDLVIFTEIMEHITFNPIRFWNQVYNHLVTNGVIYVSTPNSLALPNIIRSFYNLITLKGIGIKTKDIFSYVTYGHHWKEYSKYEIKKYFSALSDDFEIEVNYYQYSTTVGLDFRTRVWYSLKKLGALMFVFSPELEAIVTKKEGSNGFKLNSPEYY